MYSVAVIPEQRTVRNLFLFLVTAVLTLGAVVAVPGVASAAGSSNTWTITTAQPKYTHMTDPCVNGNQSTHYRLIEARIVGTSASLLSATVTPSGFRANLGVYDGAFMPEMPIVNCMGNLASGSVGAPVTYSTPTPSLTPFPGITERNYLFVVAGQSAGDLGQFSLSVTSSNATAVELRDITDVTPPELTVPGNMTVEATKPAGADVTFTASATDSLDGVRPVECSPASGATFPIAKTRVNCTASDLSGNEGTKGFNITVKDTTGPALTLPPSMTAEATGADGATVTFAATANDIVDGSRPVECTPASGTTFPRGTTSVSCASSDTRGNATTRTFNVIVTNGALPITGDLVVAGTAKVGSTLTATSSLTTTPAATRVEGQWLRGSEEIASATSLTYTLTAADQGEDVTFRQTFGADGYNDAVRTSNAVGPVEPGDIAVSQPTVQGTAQVGEVLATIPGSVLPADATQTYEWFAGTDSLGSGPTYTVKAADHGKKIHVVATATRNGYATVSRASTDTAAVVAGVMTSSGLVSVLGPAKVNQALFVSSSVQTNPVADGISGQWFRGSEPIASSPLYVPTNADAGSELTYVETRTKPGYEDVVSTSVATAKISGGLITLPAPTVAGNYAVDETLVAAIPGLDPVDAAVSYKWSINGNEVGTGSTYTLKPGDVGGRVDLAVSASKPYFELASSAFGPSVPVERATFGAGPAAAISGVFMVGEKLTAVEGALAPLQDSFAYQWFVDGDPIQGATEKTFALTESHRGAKVAVEVTAKRAGYVDASSTSAESAAIVDGSAPTVTLKQSASKLRLGQSMDLTWTSKNAGMVEASGSWTGAKAPSGTQTVKPAATGTATYILRAKNNAGTTTAQVAVPVGLSAAKLRITGNSRPRADRTFTVVAAGLVGGEKYTIRLADKIIATGQATKAGQVSRAVRVPSSVKAGTRALQVTGSLSDRTGVRSIKVVRTTSATVRLADSKVRASKRQRVTISKLMSGEKVTVTYQGRRISTASARANSKGVFTMTFNVGNARGKKTVTVSTDSSSRTVKKAFSVTR